MIESNLSNPSLPKRKSTNATPEVSVKIKTQIKNGNVQTDNILTYKGKNSAANNNNPNQKRNSPNYSMVNNYSKKYYINDPNKEYFSLANENEQSNEGNQEYSYENSKSPTVSINFRYPFHQNDAVRPPPKRREKISQEQKTPISKIAPKNRCNSVQLRSNKERINLRKVSNDTNEIENKINLRKLWQTLSQHLRRSKQRIVLFHSSRRIIFQRTWKFFALGVNRKNRILIIKVKIFKAAVSIINKIFAKNKIQPIPASYVSKPLIYNLNNSTISNVLTALLRLYYNRRKSQERKCPLSVSIPEDICSDTETAISHSKMHDLIHEAISNSPILIREFDIDDETAEELIPVVNFTNETKAVSGNHEEVLDNLLRLTRRDIRLVVNDRIVSNIVNSVYDQIEYPIEANLPDREAIKSVVSCLNVEDSLLFVSKPNLDSIFDMTQKDMKVYVNNRIINSIENDIWDEIDLPIQYNTVDDATAREIVEDDIFDDVIESEFSIPYINKDYERENNRSSLIKMLNLESVDIRAYVSGRFVDETIESLFNQISTEMPIAPNTPSNETCREIVDFEEFTNLPYGSYIEDENEVSSWVDPVYRYQPKDILLYVNRRSVGRVVSQLYSQVKNSLPIVPNTVDPEDIEQIIQAPIEDSLTALPSNSNEPIRNFKAKDIQLYVNGRVIDRVINSVFNLSEIPIEPNEVTQKQVDDILEDEFIDVYDLFSTVDDWIDPLMNVDPYNRRISLDKSCVSKALNSVVLKTFAEIPIVPNTVDDETLIEIVDCEETNCCMFEDECIESIDPLVDVSKLENIEAVDMCMYVNQRNIDEIIESFYNSITFPITLNEPDQNEIDEIVKTELEDSLLGLPLGLPKSFKEYKPKDVQFYVNNRIVDRYMGSMFNSIDLPLTENQIEQKDIDEILEDEDFGDGVPPMSERSIIESLQPLFSNFDSGERRIDFDFPIKANQFALKAISHLPLCPNDVTDSEIGSILTCLDDQITFKKSSNPNDIDLGTVLPLNGVDPLKRYIAPVEVFESVDDVVDRLMNRILANEILPSMPLEPQVFVENQTANAILSALAKTEPDSVLIDDKSIFKLLLTKPKTVFNIDPLKEFDVIEQPNAISPDDVLNGLLWREILPALPIVPKRKRYVDILDVVDEIVLDNYLNNDANPSKKTTNRSYKNEIICNLFNDSDNSYEIEENSPCLMTSPSNQSSPMQSASPPDQKNQQQYVKSYLDTSTESMIEEEDNNSKQIVVNSNNVEKVEVKVDDDDISHSFEDVSKNEINNIEINNEEINNVEIDKVEINNEEIDNVEIDVFEEEEEEISIIEEDVVDANVELVEKKENKIETIVDYVIEEEEEDEMEIDIDFDINENDSFLDDEEDIELSDE